MGLLQPHVRHGRGDRQDAVVFHGTAFLGSARLRPGALLLFCAPTTPAVLRNAAKLTIVSVAAVATGVAAIRKRADGPEPISGDADRHAARSRGGVFQPACQALRHTAAAGLPVHRAPGRRGRARHRLRQRRRRLFRRLSGAGRHPLRFRLRHVFADVPTCRLSRDHAGHRRRGADDAGLLARRAPAARPRLAGSDAARRHRRLDRCRRRLLPPEDRRADHPRPGARDAGDRIRLQRPDGDLPHHRAGRDHRCRHRRWRCRRNLDRLSGHLHRADGPRPSRRLWWRHPHRLAGRPARHGTRAAADLHAGAGASRLRNRRLRRRQRLPRRLRGRALCRQPRHPLGRDAEAFPGRRELARADHHVPDPRPPGDAVAVLATRAAGGRPGAFPDLRGKTGSDLAVPAALRVPACRDGLRRVGRPARRRVDPARHPARARRAGLRPYPLQHRLHRGPGIARGAGLDDKSAGAPARPRRAAANRARRQVRAGTARLGQSRTARLPGRRRQPRGAWRTSAALGPPLARHPRRQVDALPVCRAPEGGRPRLPVHLAALSAAARPPVRQSGAGRGRRRRLLRPVRARSEPPGARSRNGLRARAQRGGAGSFRLPR